MTRADFATLARMSYLAPRTAARAVLDMRLPAAQVWQALLLVAILLTLIGALSTSVRVGERPLASSEPSLLVTVVVHAVLIALPAALVFLIGERTGSKASFLDAMTLLLWLQFLVLPLQVLVTLGEAMQWSLTNVFLTVYMAAVFWLLTNFVTELHGYKSRRNVFLGVVTVAVVLGLLLLPFLDPAFAGDSDHV